MLYSTAATTCFPAVLTRVSGGSTLELARAWLGAPLGIEIPPWARDPQGIYLGGNNMLLSPRALLLRFGEMYRQAASTRGGRSCPSAGSKASWTARVRSRYRPCLRLRLVHGRSAAGHPVCYGWGYGGQMIYVVPDLALTARS